MAAGCFLGSSSVGTLRFGGDGPAILFPPYAVLTAALMLAPVRHWWLYLLASSIGSVGPHLAISPTPHALLAEPANYTKAIVAAAGVRWAFGSIPRDLGTLNRMAWFLLFACGVGPICGALIGAKVATTFSGAPSYWLVCRGWLMSNAMTGMTLLPVILLGVNRIAGRPSRPTARRVAEAAVLYGGIIAVGVHVFSAPADSPILPSHLIWPFPLLLWSAVRFGPGGTGLSLWALAIVAIWGALGGVGPFTAHSPAEDLLELQFFLIATSVPLLLLASLVQQDRQMAAAVASREVEARRQAAELATSQQLNVAILASLRERVAVLDGHGIVIAVNDAWTSFPAVVGAPITAGTSFEKQGIGTDYLGVCGRSADAGEADARLALDGIQSVLDGTTRWFEMEYRCATPALELWFLMSVTPLDYDNASAGRHGAVVLHRDVTDLKHAEQVMSRSEASLRASNHRAQELAGRLISAQEAERSRIARELHDDVDQQLVAISLSISALRRGIPEGTDPSVQHELAGIQRLAINAAEDVRLLSHELHPGVLRHAGLTAALKSFCNEFRARHGLGVTFEPGEGIEALVASAGPDASLCLYRAAQEALANVARHAGARHAHVTLACAGPETPGIELCVRDDGRGFDVDAAREAGGLGLRSIDERARLVRGTATIESTVHKGTVVRLVVPAGGSAHASADSIACG